MAGRHGGLRRVLARTSIPTGTTIALEASTGYSKWPDVPDVTTRIEEFAAQHGTRFRFLYIVRDPLQMIGSGLGHGQDRGWGKGSREKLLRHLLNVANFNMQMSRYRECFALEDMHVLQLERLATDHVGQLDPIARFLGLGSGFVTTSVKAAKHNSTEIRQANLSRKTVVARVSQVVPLKPLWSIVPSTTRDSLRPLANWLVSGRRRAADQPERWRLTDAEREDIARRLRPGVRDLAAAYGIDPTLWPDYSAALNGHPPGA